MARLDKYLAKIAGQDVQTPAPQNSMDKSLSTIAESGGAGGNAIWNDALKNIVIVTLEQTDDNAAALECDCSDGIVLGYMYFESDAESGDIRIMFDEWTNHEEEPVPAEEFSSITAALETAIYYHYSPLVHSPDISRVEQRIVVCRWEGA